MTSNFMDFFDTLHLQGGNALLHSFIKILHKFLPLPLHFFVGQSIMILQFIKTQRRYTTWQKNLFLS